jgi:carboxyl-terminal processing protease
VFPAGQESAAVDEYQGDHTAGKDAAAFANPVDQAFAVLVARAWPAPQPTAMAEGAVAALCEEFRRQGGGDVSTEDRREWASTAARTRRFESVFEGLDKRAAAPLARPPLTQAALRGMLAKSGWSEAMLLGENEKAAFKQLQAARDKPSGEPGRLGLRLDHWPAVEVVPQTPAAEAGMKTGDVLVKVDGKDVPAAAGAAEALRFLAGPAGKAVTLAVRRGETALEFHIQRAGAGAVMVSSARLDRGVLYIQIPTLEGQGIGEKVCRLVREGGGSAPAIILDLRDDPGGRPEEADAIAGAFLNGKLLHILEFRSGKRIGFQSPAGAIATPVVVLINRNTGSAAEMLAMALRDNGRAALIGEKSAGALFGKDLEELKSGSVILFRTEPTVLSPSGKDYSVRGIPADIECADKREAGRDAVLQAAMKFIEQQGRP